MTVHRIGLSLKGDAADLHLDASGNLVLARDAEAVGQHARQRLMAHQGEWFLDTEVGVPWIGDILGAPENTALAEAVIKAEILDTDGVTGIAEIAVRSISATRRLDVPRARITTEYEEDVPL